MTMTECIIILQRENAFEIFHFSGSPRAATPMDRRSAGAEAEASPSHSLYRKALYPPYHAVACCAVPCRVAVRFAVPSSAAQRGQLFLFFIPLSESRRRVSFLRGGREKVGEEREKERGREEKRKGGSATWTRGRQRQKGNGGRLSGGLRGDRRERDDGSVVRFGGLRGTGGRRAPRSRSLFGK